MRIDDEVRATLPAGLDANNLVTLDELSAGSVSPPGPANGGEGNASFSHLTAAALKAVEQNGLGRGDRGAASAQHHRAAWAPPSAAAVGVDPNTSLPLLALGGAFKAFAGLIVHAFCQISQVTYKGRHLSDRVLVLTDTTLFMCGLDAQIGRAIAFRAIAKAVAPTTQPETVIFCVPTEMDLVAIVGTADERTELLATLDVAYRAASFGTRLTIEYPDHADPGSFNLRRPMGFEVQPPPQRTLDHLRAASGNGPVELKAVGRLLRKEALMAGLHNRKASYKSKEEAADRRIAALQADLRLFEETSSENALHIDRLKTCIAEADKRIIAKHGHLLTEEERLVHRAKRRKIEELEASLQSLQQHLFETEHVTDTGLNKKIRALLFPPDAAPSALVLVPENVPVGRLVPTLEAELISKELVLQTLQKEAQNAKKYKDAVAERDALILWLERANLAAGLPFLSSEGALSGIHGPWPAKHVPPTASAISEHAKRVGDAPDEEEEFVAVNGALLPLKGFSHIDQLEVDPRTGLRIVEVTPNLREEFKDVVNTVVHFFGPVRTKTGLGHKHIHKRILIVSDQSFYICSYDGSIRRCIDILDMVDVFLDMEGTGAGIRVDGEHDLLMQCVSSTHRDLVVECVLKLQAYANDGMNARVVIRQLAYGQKAEERLSLTKSPDWRFKIVPLRTKEELMRDINKKLHGGADPSSEEHWRQERVRTLWQPIKEYMEIQFENGLNDENTEIGSLRKRVHAKEEVLRDISSELLSIKKAVMDHQCEGSVSGEREYKVVAKPFNPSASRYTWLPVAPLVLDVGMDVTVLKYQGDIIATGHANGWVQVWSIEKLSHLQTLQEHTGKITSIVFYKKGTQDGEVAEATPGTAADSGDGERGTPYHETFDLLTSSSDSSIRRWDLKNYECSSVLQTHRGGVSVLSLCRARLASAGSDTVVNVWSLEEEGKEVPVHVLRGHKNAVVDLHLDGNLLISAEWGWVFAWDVAAASITKAFRDEYGGIRRLCVNESFVVVCGDNGDVNVWDVVDGSSKTINGTGDDIIDAHLHDRYVITSGADCRIRTWNVASLQMIDIFHNSYPNPITTFQLDDLHFIGAEGRYLRMWLK
ncbi:putative E3 ubiquitin ligase complex SCF subunit sconB [Diplonema papillatum]|nr:putative E3 ubiquitin ligase complex SCF subunit sconB [Diplonema papillatum]